MAESLLDSAFNGVSHLFGTYYYSIITAVIILLVGLTVGKLLGRIVQRVLHGMEADAILKRATQADIRVEQTFGSFTSYLIYAITVVIVLNQLNVTTTILQIIIAGIIIIIIVAAALAVKDFIPNAFAGFYILKNKMLEEGQAVRIKGVEGRVVTVTLIETKLQTKDGDMVHIPNSSITKSELVKLKALRGKKK